MSRSVRNGLLAVVAAAMMLPASAFAQNTNRPGGPGALPGRQPPPPMLRRKKPLSPGERAVLKEIESDFKKYARAAGSHHSRMRSILRREYDKRRKQLEDRYVKRMAAAKESQRLKHLREIALLIKFIKDHPNHTQFTPDAMYRLADLYLDEAERIVDEKEISDPDGDHTADYTKALALWEQIIRQFPTYRQMANTLYLFAYYGAAKDERRSLQLYLALACANKFKPLDAPPKEPTKTEWEARQKSKTLLDPYVQCTPIKGAAPELVRHAWVRGIGDQHFATPGELDEAISSYKKVTGNTRVRLYEEALYKLAWSYYRRDFLLDAIKQFDKSVIRYDKIVASGKTPKIQLRDEALQYIAVSLTDPWAGELETDPTKAFSRAMNFYKGREKEKHVRDVWVTIGQAFQDIQAYDQAIASFMKAIGKPWHLHPENPVVHQRIVDAFEAKGDETGANEEGGKLATRYSPGTPWYIANEKNRKAMKNQRRIAQRMLYGSARNMHKAAAEKQQEYIAGGSTDAEMKKEYLELYAKAIKLYNTFLTQYPESEHVYAFTHALAECYFYTDRYMDSVKHYRWVRDHRNLSTELFEDSAKSIVKAYEAEAELQIKAGKLQPLTIPNMAALSALPKPIQKKEIPKVHLELQKAYDEYQKLVNEPKTAPKMGLNAALVSLAYLHLDDALKRFDFVLKKFCDKPQASRAKDGMLVIYKARDNDTKYRETNAKFIAGSCGTNAQRELAKAQNRTLEFDILAKLYKNKEFEKAGLGYYRYYKNAPSDDKNWPVALYNSALAYKEAGKNKTAIYLFKEFTKRAESRDKENKPFRESEYYVVALDLTAKSYQAAFDYKTAVTTYMRLYDIAGKAQKLGLKKPPAVPGEPQKDFAQIRLDALYNAALFKELDRDFLGAIKMYRRYAREEKKKRPVDRALWAIARLYKAMGNIQMLEASYRTWRRRFGRTNYPAEKKNNNEDYVFTYYDMVKQYSKKGRRFRREVAKYRKETMKAWERIGKPQDTLSARRAGEFELADAERYYDNVYKPYKIKTRARNAKHVKQILGKLDKIAKKAQNNYLLGVGKKYGVPEFAMAAKVRYGEILMLYSEKYYEMPTPKYVTDLDRKYPDQDVIGKYEQGVQDALAPYTKNAKAQWEGVVKAARAAGVHNEWVQEALENLNREFPSEWPAQHAPLVEGTAKTRP